MACQNRHRYIHKIINIKRGANMRTKNIDGKIMKMFEASGEAVTNEEHFKHDFEQVIRHYAMILDVEEMKKFSEDVINSHF